MWLAPVGRTLELQWMNPAGHYRLIACCIGMAPAAVQLAEVREGDRPEAAATLRRRSASHPSWKAHSIREDADMIQLRHTGEGNILKFEVVVREGKSETRHTITMSAQTCERLIVGKYTPERSLKVAFRFLLDREQKESILSHFDVTVISRYFPDFERELPRYLSQP
jgi:hypothetical protein